MLPPSRNAVFTPGPFTKDRRDAPARPGPQGPHGVPQVRRALRDVLQIPLGLWVRHVHVEDRVGR